MGGISGFVSSANFLLLTLPVDLNCISQHAKSPKQKLQGRKASLKSFVASFCHILLVKSEHRTIQVSRGGESGQGSDYQERRLTGADGGRIWNAANQAKYKLRCVVSIILTVAQNHVGPGHLLNFKP